MREIKNNHEEGVVIGPVAVWLFTLVGLVTCMVVLGGLTRLTGSGLSMVEWNPHVVLPPLSANEWHETFLRYQQSPQFRLVNSDMDLAGFKEIFWLEYIHRLWGRMLGLAVLVPLVILAWKGRIDRSLSWRLGGIFLLGAAEGGLGWLMVASGLVDRPEVSHFRLAAHLAGALVILGLLLWLALGAVGRAAEPRHADSARMGRALIGALILATVTIVWGAFTAGLKAGLIYNTFPLMNGSWLPDDGLDILGSHGGVQFAHRVLALATVATLTVLWRWSRGLVLSKGTRRGIAFAASWSWAQACLGVATLLTQVPVALATLHQLGAIVLFGLLVWALFEATRPPVVRQVAKLTAQPA